MFRASQLFIRFSFPFPPRVRCLTPHPTFTTPTIPHHVLPCPTARAVPCCPPVITNLVAAKLCIAIAYSHYKMHVKDHVTLMIKNRKESYMLAFDILGTSRGVESGEDKTVSAYACCGCTRRCTSSRAARRRTRGRRSISTSRPRCLVWSIRISAATSTEASSPSCARSRRKK